MGGQVRGADFSSYGTPVSMPGGEQGEVSASFRPSLPVPGGTQFVPPPGPSSMELAQMPTQDQMLGVTREGDQDIADALSPITNVLRPVGEWATRPIGGALPTPTGAQYAQAIPFLRDHPDVAGVMAGLNKGAVAPLVDFPRTPVGASLLALTAGTGAAGAGLGAQMLHRLLLGGFTVHALSQVPGAVGRLIEAEGVEETAEALGEMGLLGVVAGRSGYGALKGIKSFVKDARYGPAVDGEFTLETGPRPPIDPARTLGEPGVTPPARGELGAPTPTLPPGMGPRMIEFPKVEGVERVPEVRGDVPSGANVGVLPGTEGFDLKAFLQRNRELEREAQAQEYRPPVVSTDLRQLEKQMQRNTVPIAETFRARTKDRQGPEFDPTGELLEATAQDAAEAKQFFGGRKQPSPIDPNTKGYPTYYGSLHFLGLDFWKSRVKLAKDTAVDAKQMYNRLKNVMGEESGAWQMLNTEAFRDFLKAGTKVNLETVRDWVDKNGPKVEVRELGVGDIDPLQQREAALVHAIDTAGYHMEFDGEELHVSDMTRSDIGLDELPESVRANILELRDLPHVDPIDSESATARYMMVNPKPLDQMPGAVDLLTRLPVEPRSTADLAKAYKERFRTEPDELDLELYRKEGYTEENVGTRYNSPHYPKEGRDLVVHTRGYFEDGGKTFSLIEVQSDWAQRYRDLKQNNVGTGSPEFLNHPLLAKYEQLGLKSSIDYAKKHGATHIFVPDAETAMLSEQHDSGYNVKPREGTYNPEELKNVPVGSYDKRSFTLTGEATYEGGWHLKTKEGVELPMGELDQNSLNLVEDILDASDIPMLISQEEGMRLHYDQTLQKAARQLTGDKGTRVDYGEHKNAVESISQGRTMQGPLDQHGNAYQKAPRKDLIFKNPDGTPKTTITGWKYDITKTKDDFSFFGKDEPVAPQPTAPRGIAQRKGSSEEGSFRPGLLIGKIADSLRSQFNIGQGKRTTPLMKFPFRFRSYAEEMKEATTPQGIGSVPYMGLFDPRRRMVTPEERAVATYNYLNYKADTGVALWLEDMKTVDPGFVVVTKQSQGLTPNTSAIGMITLANGSHAPMEDVMRTEMAAPGTYPLTPEQKAIVGLWKSVHDDGVQWAVSKGVTFFVDENGVPRNVTSPYFPRPTISSGAKGQGKVGSKGSTQKERAYDTEFAGIRAGVKYEPDVFKRMAIWMRDIYKAVAARELINDPELAKLSRPGNKPRLGESMLSDSPAFAGRVYPKEVADRMRAIMQQALPSKYRVLAKWNDGLKAMQFASDASAPVNQGQAAMFLSPVRWARASTEHLKSFFDAKQLSKYLKQGDNMRIALIFASRGSGVTRLQDQLAGGAEGEFLQKFWPVRASTRAMGNFQTMMRIELYKGFEPLIKDKGWSQAEAVEAIDNLTMSGRMEAAGVDQAQALIERVLLIAPSFGRAFFSNVANTVKPGAQGGLARRGALALVTGMMAFSYVVYKMQGLSDEEIVKRFDLTDPGAFRFNFVLKDGTAMSVSLPGMALSTARATGSTIDWMQGGHTITPEQRNNPLVKFIDARKGPLLNFIYMLTSQRDYQGEAIGFLETLSKTIPPIVFQPVGGYLSGRQSGQQTAAEVAGQFAGLNISPESFTSYKQRRLDITSKEMFNGAAYSTLNASDRNMVYRVAKPEIDKNKPTFSARQRVKAEEAAIRFKDKLRTSLTKSAQTRLAEYDLSLPGTRVDIDLDDKRGSLGLSIGGSDFKSKKIKDVPILWEERKHLEEVLVREYKKRLDPYLEQTITPTQAGIDQRVEAARKAAKREVVKALGN